MTRAGGRSFPRIRWRAVSRQPANRRRRAAIRLARQKLELLEQQAVHGQGDLFAELPPPEAPQPNALSEELAAIDPDELTPKQALELIYHLKRLAKP